MTSLLNLPKISYIVFELIKLKVGEKPYEDGVVLKDPVYVDTVLLDVLPTRLRYMNSSKKTYLTGYGDNNTYVSKGGNAPDKIVLSGTFGQRFIQRGIQVQDGFGRLKEFKKLYKTTQEVKKFKPVDYLYGLNYYDFTNHYWGSIELDTFEIDEDGQRNTKLPFYNITMTGLGELYKVKTTDPILRNLKYYIDIQNKLDEWNIAYENFLETNEATVLLNEIIVDIVSFQEALNMANVAIAGYSTAVGVSVIGDVASATAEVNRNLFSMSQAGKDFFNLLY